MYIVCLDLESVLIPEIWVAIANTTGIQELHLTTRDIANYDVLMKQRIHLLRAHNITLSDIQQIITSITPFPDGVTFLHWLRNQVPTIILTDSFHEFVTPLMDKLAYPTIFCNSLEVDRQGFITNYRLRQPNGKEATLKALKTLNFQTIAIGDSYNDINMLRVADIGILFKPTVHIQNEFSAIPAVQSYDELQNQLRQYVDLTQAR